MQTAVESQRHRAPWWLKPKIDPDVQSTIRQMCKVDEDDDLPENVLHMLALCSAFTPDFNDKIGGLTGRWELGVRVLVADQIVKPLKEKSWIVPGSRVTIRSRNRDAVYVSGGPGRNDLVNFAGLFALVPTSDIEADSLSVVSSRELRLLRMGESLSNRLNGTATVALPSSTSPPTC